MPLELGGVQFSIQVTAGKSAGNAREVAKALRELNKELERTQDLSGEIDINFRERRRSGSNSRSGQRRSSTSPAAASAAGVGAAAVSVSALANRQAAILAGSIASLNRAVITQTDTYLRQSRLTAEQFAAMFSEALRKWLDQRPPGINGTTATGTTSSVPPRRITVARVVSTSVHYLLPTALINSIRDVMRQLG